MYRGGEEASGETMAGWRRRYGMNDGTNRNMAG